MSRVYLLIMLFSQLISVNTYSNDISVITDLDDTLKVTNSGNFRKAVVNALFRVKAFTAMPDLLKEMEYYTNRTYVLSASPRIINKSIRKFLRVHKIKYDKLYTRNLKQLRNKFKYKVNTIRKIMKRSDDDFILIGDNVEIDDKVYLKIKEEFKDRVLKIYIHKIKNKTTKPGVYGYFTALDIWKSEYLSGRMTMESLSNQVEKFRNLSRKQLVRSFPKFAYCPKNKEDFTSIEIPSLVDSINEIHEKILKFCENR